MSKRYWQNIRKRNGCFQKQAFSTTICNAKYVCISELYLYLKDKGFCQDQETTLETFPDLNLFLILPKMHTHGKKIALVPRAE